MLIGENIKRERLKKGFTQSQLAEKSGIKINQISKIERGESDPKSSTIESIIRGLGCDANSLFLNEKEIKTDERLEAFIRQIKKLKETDQIIIIDIIEKFKIAHYVAEIQKIKESKTAELLIGKKGFENIEIEKIDENKFMEMQWEVENYSPN